MSIGKEVIRSIKKKDNIEPVFFLFQHECVHFYKKKVMCKYTVLHDREVQIYKHKEEQNLLNT